MNDRHLSTQFDAELSGISTRVLEMGGMVESQVARAVHALTNFSGEVASEVLATEERVNPTEVEIDRDLSTIIARRQPTARDLRLLIAISQDDRQPRAGRRRGGADRAHRAAPGQLRRVEPHAPAGQRPRLRVRARGRAAAQGARRVRPARRRAGGRGAEEGRPDRPGVRGPDAQADHLHDGRPAHDLLEHRPGVRRQGDRAGRRPREEPGRADHLHRQGHRRAPQPVGTVENLVR